MYTYRFLSLLFALLACLGPARSAESARNARTYVIVHGAFGGGWDWKTVDRLLTAKGHTVYRPTLTGLGEHVHLASPAIGLQTHVDDIINLIRYEDLHDVVLVGHSYAGSVITGVLDKIPDRISHVIFLDAVVPNDGESFVAAVSAAADPTFPKFPPLVDGFYVPSWVPATKAPPMDSPQPARTWSDPVSYRNPAAKKVAGTYVSFTADGRPPAADGKTPGSRYQWFMFERAKARGWNAIALQSDHVAERTHPTELAELLDQAH